MAQEFAKSFYDSQMWKKCRRSFINWRIAEDGGLCQMCGEIPGYIVHHRQKLTPENIGDPYITTSFDNLMYVCHECHNTIHFCDWQHIEYVFVDGQPVPLSEVNVTAP